MLLSDTSLKAIHNPGRESIHHRQMSMLLSDTSLKAIHNDDRLRSLCSGDVYAFIRYKFESNSQLGTLVGLATHGCLCFY